MFRRKEDLYKLPLRSTGVIQRNILNRYIDRPDLIFHNSKFAAIDLLRLAEFLSYCCVQSRFKPRSQNDCQIVVLDDELMKTKYFDSQYINTIPLTSSKEKSKRRKVKAVLRYHVTNSVRYVGKFARLLLCSFYPFRNEKYLRHPPFTGIYFAKLLQPVVSALIYRNSLIMEPFREVVDNQQFKSALNNVFEFLNRSDTFSKKENDEAEQQMGKSVARLLQNDGPAEEVVLLKDINQLQNAGSVIVPNAELNLKIKSLNEWQREIFDLVHN